MSDTAARAATRQLNITKVNSILRGFGPLTGGWCTPAPGDASGTSHYFPMQGEGEEARCLGIALCGFADPRNELDLDECDPLALENCKVCRAKLLQHRRLI